MARKGRYGIYKPIILKNNVVAVQNYTLTVDTGFYNLTGENVTLNVGANINVDTGFYNLIGNDVSFVYVPNTPTKPSSVNGGGGGGSSSSRSELEDMKRKMIDDNNLISIFKIFLEQCQ